MSFWHRKAKAEKHDIGAVLDLAYAYESRTGKKPDIVQVPYGWVLPEIPAEYRVRAPYPCSVSLFGMLVQFGDRLGIGRREVIGGVTLEYWQWQS